MGASRVTGATLSRWTRPVGCRSAEAGSAVVNYAFVTPRTFSSAPCCVLMCRLLQRLHF